MLQARQRQFSMLDDNVGFNISPTAWDNYPTIGVTDRLGTSGLGSAETHVKDFMIRHQKMLGLGDEDIQILQILRDKGL